MQTRRKKTPNRLKTKSICYARVGLLMRMNVPRSSEPAIGKSNQGVE